MQKRFERFYRADSGIPLLVLALCGLLFFGAYVAIEQLYSPSPIAIWKPLLFLAAYVLLASALYVVYRIKSHRRHDEQVTNETLNTKMHNVFKYMVGLPYVIVDEQGRVRVMNEALQTLIGAKDPFYRGNISDLCGGTTLRDIIDAERHKPVTHLAIGSDADGVAELPKPGFRVTENGVVVRLWDCGRYTARSYEISLNSRTNYLVTFTDVSELFDLQEKRERELPALAYIDVDNLEELTQYTHASYRDISRRVDDVLIHWAADMNGFLREYERDRYIMLFSQEKLIQCEEDKFSQLLDGVRDIRLGEYIRQLVRYSRRSLRGNCAP